MGDLEAAKENVWLAVNGLRKARAEVAKAQRSVSVAQGAWDNQVLTFWKNAPAHAKVKEWTLVWPSDGPGKGDPGKEAPQSLGELLTTIYEYGGGVSQSTVLRSIDPQGACTTLEELLENHPDLQAPAAALTTCRTAWVHACQHRDQAVEAQLKALRTYMLACASLRTAKLEAQQWILHCGHSAQANKALTPGELAVELETGSLQGNDMSLPQGGGEPMSAQQIVIRWRESVAVEALINCILDDLSKHKELLYNINARTEPWWCYKVDGQLSQGPHSAASFQNWVKHELWPGTSLVHHKSNPALEVTIDSLQPILETVMEDLAAAQHLPIEASSEQRTSVSHEQVVKAVSQKLVEIIREKDLKQKLIRQWVDTATSKLIADIDAGRLPPPKPPPPRPVPVGRRRHAADSEQPPAVGQPPMAFPALQAAQAASRHLPDSASSPAAASPSAVNGHARTNGHRSPQADNPGAAVNGTRKRRRRWDTGAPAPKEDLQKGHANGSIEGHGWGAVSLDGDAMPEHRGKGDFGQWPAAATALNSQACAQEASDAPTSAADAPSVSPRGEHSPTGAPGGLPQPAPRLGETSPGPKDQSGSPLAAAARELPGGAATLRRTASGKHAPIIHSPPSALPCMRSAAGGDVPFRKKESVSDRLGFPASHARGVASPRNGLDGRRLSRSPEAAEQGTSAAQTQPPSPAPPPGSRREVGNDWKPDAVVQQPALKKQQPSKQDDKPAAVPAARASRRLSPRDLRRKETAAGGVEVPTESLSRSDGPSAAAPVAVRPRPELPPPRDRVTRRGAKAWKGRAADACPAPAADPAKAAEATQPTGAAPLVPAAARLRKLPPVVPAEAQSAWPPAAAPEVAPAVDDEAQPAVSAEGPSVKLPAQTVQAAPPAANGTMQPQQKDSSSSADLGVNCSAVPSAAEGNDGGATAEPDALEHQADEAAGPASRPPAADEEVETAAAAGGKAAMDEAQEAGRAAGSRAALEEGQAAGVPLNEASEAAHDAAAAADGDKRDTFIQIGMRGGRPYMLKNFTQEEWAEAFAEMKALLVELGMGDRIQPKNSAAAAAAAAAESPDEDKDSEDGGINKPLPPRAMREVMSLFSDVKHSPGSKSRRQAQQSPFSPSRPAQPKHPGVKGGKVTKQRKMLVLEKGKGPSRPAKRPKAVDRRSLPTGDRNREAVQAEVICSRALPVHAVSRQSALASRAQQLAVVAAAPAEASEGRASRLQLRQLARSCDDIIQDVALYKKLKGRAADLRLGRSGVHAWGLFARKPIPAGEFVIEYVGELIRLSVNDVRERADADSDYRFRVDTEWVVDATRKGGPARYINHCCDPNCYTKTVSVAGQRHIMIYSKRAILEGEELTYDYKFQYTPGEEPIPCTCGARNCRRRLN